MRASGDCPIVLMTGSQPSSNSGLVTGAVLVSTGAFTALRLFPAENGILSAFNARLIAGATKSSDWAAEFADTSSAIKKEAAAKATPQQAMVSRD
jgi:hypothetical protein